MQTTIGEDVIIAEDTFTTVEDVHITEEDMAKEQLYVSHRL